MRIRYPKWLQPDHSVDAAHEAERLAEAQESLIDARRLLAEAQRKDADVDTMVRQVEETLHRNRIGRKLRLAVRVGHR